MTYMEAIIKINITESPERKARDIEEGIGYACALLHDEYGRTADEIENLLEQVIDNVRDDENRRNNE